MPLLPMTNHQPNGTTGAKAPESSEEKPKRAKGKGPSLAQKYAKPLPLEVHPLPAFHVSNPLSLLRLAYTWISHVLFPHSSHPDADYIGYFSPETRSVHVTDPKTIRALWERGFFGKGTLSRSEPSWLAREKARLLKESNAFRGRAAPEDLRNARREERRLFKFERAILERERVERQKMIEDGQIDPDGAVTNDLDTTPVINEGPPDSHAEVDGDSIDDLLNVHAQDQSRGEPNGDIHGHAKETFPLQATESQTQLLQQDTTDVPQVKAPADEDEEPEPQINDQEHLQLSFEETFFLSYGLGVLSIYPTNPPDPPAPPYTTTDLVELFCQYSSFPPSAAPWITPDDQFLLNYVTYHHFRSLGWVVRSGLQFSVDYLLYNRGPVFAHAEFAVLIIPAYTDRYWNTPGGRARRRVYEQKDWWWLHCVNRVQSAVFKTLVLCYVDVPSELDLDFDEGLDVGKLLRSYKVRDFVVRRWVPNRTRD